MKKYIIDEIKKLNKKTFGISELEEKIIKNNKRYIDQYGYTDFYEIINELVEENVLEPIKNSFSSGRTNLGYSRYKLVSKKEDLNYLKTEILYLHPSLCNNIYIKKIDKYLVDKDKVLILDKYLKDKNNLSFRYTANERSYEIFGDEKYILSKEGTRLLNNLNITLEDLNCYKTNESFFYAYEEKDIINALIIENKDTYTSLYKYFLDNEGLILFSKQINLLIYGEGKKIVSSFSYINDLVKDNKIHEILYFGDIDAEGLRIFEKLNKKYPEFNIIPFSQMYRELLSKASELHTLKNKQMPYVDGEFIKLIDYDIQDKLLDIVTNSYYIPQEALNSYELFKLINKR